MKNYIKIPFIALLIILALPKFLRAQLTLCVTGSATNSYMIMPGVSGSSNHLIANVSGDSIIGVSAGLCDIYTSSGSVSLAVYPYPSPILGANPICVGDTATLSDGMAFQTWSISGGIVASISSSGLVTGMSTGTTIISYVTSHGCSTVRTETVNPLPEVGAIVGPHIVETGGSITLLDSLGGGTWSSGSPSIASIDGSGFVTGVTAGLAVITYSLTNSCGTASAKDTITVTSTAGIRATPTKTEIQVFPNPAKGDLQIYTDVGAFADLTVVNEAGKAVAMQKIKGAVTQINIAALPAGNYFLILRGTSGMQIKTIQKIN